MILGIGTDIVSIRRMEDLLRRRGERLARRLLSARELEEYRAAPDRAAFLAKRFAVKEATAKALGTGFREGIIKAHIRVRHDALGRPLLELADAAQARATQLGVRESWVSVADERDYATAFVVLAGADR